MDELIEQVARDIWEAEGPHPFPWAELIERYPDSYETAMEQARAAICAVREYDLAVGPSGAEIFEATVAHLQAAHDALRMPNALRAAAAERARVAEEVG